MLAITAIAIVEADIVYTLLPEIRCILDGFTGLGEVVVTGSCSLILIITYPELHISKDLHGLIDSFLLVRLVILLLLLVRFAATD